MRLGGHGTGYKRDLGHVAPLPRFGETPVKSSLTRAQLRARARVFDQGPYSTCTAFARKNAIWILSGVEASAAALITTTRAKEGQDLAIDDGAYPSDSRAVVQELGWCPESVCPYTSENLTRLPNLSAFLDGTDHSIRSHGVSELLGDATAQACVAALDAGLPFRAGLYVDGSYQDLKAGVVWLGPDYKSSGGGHDQLFVDYGNDAQGNLYFVSNNSWGTGWCDEGFGLIAASVIGSMATDIEVMEAAS